jgi:hypothetical protein
MPRKEAKPNVKRLMEEATRKEKINHLRFDAAVARKEGRTLDAMEKERLADAMAQRALPLKIKKKKKAEQLKLEF